MKRGLFFFLLLAGSGGILTALAACSAEAPPKQELEVEDDDSGRTTKKDATSPGKPSTGDDPVPEAGTGTGRVYAHTNDALYLFEPVGGTLSLIGTFSCLESFEDMIDIAVDRTGVMYGTTFDRLLSIDPQTAACSELAFAETEIDYPNALSFVPAGTVDPTKEALVGFAGTLSDRNNTTKYVRIDLANNGAIVPLGDLNPPGAAKKYRSSGDFVSLIQANDKTYLTVKEVLDDTETSATDYLAEIDPETGAIRAILGDTGQSNIYGLGYWAGKAYGFDYAGQITEIDPETGASNVLLSLVDDAGVIKRWYGAGVTTQAPTR